MSSLLRRLVVQNAKSNTRNYNIPANWKRPTMDDLPVPQGSWQSWNSAQQAKHNRNLIVGTGFFIVTLIVANASGLFFFNWAPPPFPPKKE